VVQGQRGLHNTMVPPSTAVRPRFMHGRLDSMIVTPINHDRQYPTDTTHVKLTCVTSCFPSHTSRTLISPSSAVRPRFMQGCQAPDTALTISNTTTPTKHHRHYTTSCI
jgi:hypothetical protein